jgi:hypothetical protein
MNFGYASLSEDGLLSGSDDAEYSDEIFSN